MLNQWKAAVSAWTCIAPAFIITQLAAQTIGTLNGIYTANDGSMLLVEEVPANDGQRLTLVMRNVELSIWRKRATDAFRYQKDGCDLTIVPTGAGGTQAFSIDAAGHCIGIHSPFEGLSIRYDRTSQSSVKNTRERGNQLSEKSEELSRNEIFELQFRLDQLGFDVGEPTGQLTAQTRRQASAFADKSRLAPARNRAVLERARAATENIEGWQRGDGTIKLLLFTDEGTPLTMTLQNWGLIFKSNARTFVRDHDRNGQPLYAQRFDVSRVERRLSIRSEPWVTFGFQMHFPTPPQGERVEIEESLTRPEIAKDGSVGRTTTVWKVPFLAKPPFDPWYWYTNLEAEADARLDGEWVMTLGQKGRALLSRTFQVQRR